MDQKNNNVIPIDFRQKKANVSPRPALADLMERLHALKNVYGLGETRSACIDLLRGFPPTCLNWNLQWHMENLWAFYGHGYFESAAIILYPDSYELFVKNKGKIV